MKHIICDYCKNVATLAGGCSTCIYAGNGNENNYVPPPEEHKKTAKKDKKKPARKEKWNLRHKPNRRSLFT